MNDGITRAIDALKRELEIHETKAIKLRQAIDLLDEEPTPEFMTEKNLSAGQQCKAMMKRAAQLEEENDLPSALSMYRQAQPLARSRQSTICKEKIKELDRKVAV